MQIGGDSLYIPIGSTDRVFLKSMLSDKNIDLLKASADGSYSMHKKDSLTVQVDAIKPVLFSLDPMIIKPIDFEFTDVKIKPFHLNSYKVNTPFPMPTLEVNKAILPIQHDKTYSYIIDRPAQNAISNKSTRNKTSKAVYYISPVTFNETGELPQTLNLGTYPLQLRHVNMLYLTNNWVYIKFDRTKINTLDLVSRKEFINSFRVDFPAEYHLSSPEGAGAKIIGSSFLIQNTTLPSDKDIVEYRLKVDSVDLSALLQNGSLIYTRPIPYNFTYTVEGETNDPSGLAGQKAEMDITINSNPIINNLSVETNAISVVVDDGVSNVTKTTNDVPDEIASISTITFEDNANLIITIKDPGIAPFKLSGGYCEIQMPITLKFKPHLGLNLETNVYTIQYNAIFGTHTLEIAGLELNQIIPQDTHTMSINEKISYKVVGLTIASTMVKTSQVDAMKGMQFEMSLTTNEISVKDAVVVTNKITTTLPTKTTNIEVNRFISNEVEKVYNTTLEKPTRFQMKLDITGLPPSIDSIFFKNYTIKFPSYLKFVAGTTNSNNEMIFNRGFKVSEGFVKDFELEGLDFGADGLVLNKGYLSLNDSVSMSGSVYVKGTNLSYSEIGTMHAIPTITLGDISLALVEGKLNPKIESRTETINLGLPKYLMDDRVKLDINNPVVTVRAGNTLGVPVDVALTLIPKRKGVVLTESIITTTLSIAAATKLGEPTWSDFWLAITAEGHSAGYQPIILPNLANLLKIIPDEILVQMDPIVTGDHHHVDLFSQKNQLDVKYEVHVPFDFGSDFHVFYEDTIGNMKAKLADIIPYTHNITLLAEVGNQIPLELVLEFIPLDKQGKKVDGVTISKPDYIKSGNVDGTPQKSNINIEVKETIDGKLAQIDAFAIAVSANRNTTIAGMPLTEKQYFSIDLRVKIPNGILYKFNK